MPGVEIFFSKKLNTLDIDYVTIQTTILLILPLLILITAS
jgi:hypothetical protein